MVVLLFSLSFILLVLYFLKISSTSTKRLPPSPLKLPIIGNFYVAGALAHRSFQSLSKRYGEVMLLQFGSKPVVVASSAKAAREIMKNQDLIFASRPRLSISDRLVYNSRDVAFATYGDGWRQGRSICMLQLLSNKRVQSFHRIREEETSLMIEEIKRSSPAVVDLSKLLMAMTNDIICRAALGRTYGAGAGARVERKDLNEILKRAVELIGTFNVGDFVPWLGWINRINGVDEEVEKVSKLLDEFLEGVIREYREKKVSGDAVMNFVDALLEFQRESEDSAPVDDDLIKALILDIFAAGTDSTYTAIEWTMAELIRNPRAMKLLQKEVREVARNKHGNNNITEDDMEKMPYLKAVSKESLRLHPPLPLALPRESTQATNLLGYDIPSSAMVLVNTWAISRDPSLWENPDEFCPERFLDHTNIDYKSLHFEMLPFGAGRRSCPGATFAMSIHELAVSKLVNEFDFGLPNGRRLEDLDMTESPGIVVHLKSPLLVDMFNAGTHTTSTALEWTVAELIKNPRAMKILESEVREVGKGKEEINEDDVEKMRYLKAAIKEGLRLHAPTPLLLPRESTQDTKVLGYDIARGTHVMVNAWAINRDPASWDDSEEFRPERFLGSSIDFRGQHSQFIPFGAGRRGCPGITFTLAVNELALAKLVHKFDFALPHGVRVEDMDMTEASGITVHRKSPLLVVATPAA